MVEYVEGFGTELESESLRQPEYAGYAQIQVAYARAPERIKALPWYDLEIEVRVVKHTGIGTPAGNGSHAREDEALQRMEQRCPGSAQDQAVRLVELRTIDDLVEQYVYRVLAQLGLPQEQQYRWRGQAKASAKSSE